MKTLLEIGVKITKMVFHIYKVNYKSVSTIPDECMGVETEISTVGGRRKRDPPENRSGRLWRNPLLYN